MINLKAPPYCIHISISIFALLFSIVYITVSNLRGKRRYEPTTVISFVWYYIDFLGPAVDLQTLDLETSSNSSIMRALAATTDPITGESVETFNGQIPASSCPLGKYRPSGSTNLVRITGQRTDGCVYCPRGIDE
jgi:hypothetical protein